MSQGGNTYCGYDLDHVDEGWIRMGCTLLDDPPPTLPSGDGTLATVDFTVLDEGSCDLDVYDTYLLDVNLDNYYHEISDGQFIFCKGDVNRDGKVDTFDLSDLSKAYGSDSSKPNWNPDADLNNDGIVDVKDLSELGQNYGKTC